MAIQLHPLFLRQHYSKCDPESTELVCSPIAVVFLILIGAIVLAAVLVFAECLCRTYCPEKCSRKRAVRAENENNA